MKTKIKIIIILLMVYSITNSYSSTWNVTAGGMSFTPANLSVTVGDTVKWVWLNGTHTTTSLTLPAGVISWSAPLDTLHQSFMYVVTQPGVYHYECIYHALFGMVGMITANPLGIEPISGDVPKSYSLKQNYPNPFNPSTNIRFDLPQASQVRLFIYDIVGNTVQTLIDSKLSAGSYSVDWKANEFPSGVYFYKLEAQNFTSTKKMILVK